MKTLTETSATQKTIHYPDVEKWMQGLEDNAAGTDVSLHEHLEKALIILGEKPRRTGSGGNTERSLRIIGLETVLKHLLDFYQKRKNETNGDLNPAVLLLIAKACYERSILILSRQDKVMVEKKKRILLKGLKVVEKVKEGNNKDALRLRSILLLELEKIDKEDPDVSDLKEALSSAIQNGCTEFDKNSCDIEISLRFAEFVKKDGGDKPLPEDVIKSLKSIVASNLQSKDVELKNAKAYYLMGNKEDDEKIIKCMKTFAEELKSVPFSDPGWSEAAGFVRELEKAGKDCWKKIALMVWEACKKRYEKSITVEHYWYFGHLMSHYYIADLAFAAQDDLEKKVEIADFLKSKILLHGQSLDDEVERFFEYNRDVRQQRFIKRMKMVYETEKKRTSGVNRRGLNEIPKDCVVIHFYLNKLERKGYAILAYPDSEWKIKIFPYEASWIITGQTMEILQNEGVPCEVVKRLKNLVDKDKWYATGKELTCALDAEIGIENTAQYKEAILKIFHVNLFEAFINFQANYCVNHPAKKPRNKQQQFIESNTTYLVKLLEQITFVMPFLFDITNKQVLFIPHDFLHRLPLHAALKKNAANSIEEVFLSKHQCYYIPTWSFASKENVPVNLKGRILFNGFSKSEDAYKALSELKWEECDDFEKILSPPELLIIGSHGKADVTSSFNSKLIRKEGDITLLKLLTSKMDTNGSCVIMCACEADLVPPLSGPLDEHISFASSLLIKNARDILGGMWIVHTEDIMEIINRIKNCSTDSLDVGLELWSWQSEKIKEGIKEYLNGDNTSFFRSIVFRVFGLPQKFQLQKPQSVYNK